MKERTTLQYYKVTLRLPDYYYDTDINARPFYWIYYYFCFKQRDIMHVQISILKKLNTLFEREINYNKLGKMSRHERLLTAKF